MELGAADLDEILAGLTPPAPPAPPAPPVEAKLPGVVAPGKYLTSKIGRLCPGQPVGPEHFNAGQKDFDHHVEVTKAIELV